MRVIAKSTLREFWLKHADSEQSLKSWFKETSDADWETPNHIKKEFPVCSFLHDNRVVFNVKGNHYRLIVKINYRYKVIWIRFIGTHAEYDAIDANTI